MSQQNTGQIIPVTNALKAKVGGGAARLGGIDPAAIAKAEAADIELTLLFDPEHDLEERILKEQFAP